MLQVKWKGSHDSHVPYVEKSARVLGGLRV